MVSDEKLMLQFQNGSQESFAELFSRYREPLYGFFRRRVTGREQAEDLSQELWLAVLQGAERYQPRALFRTYLYAIGLKLLSRDRRIAARTQTANMPENVAVTPDPNAWIRDMLRNLDEIDREILMLREYEQLAYTEIATVLRIPVNTVRSRLFRARLALKRLIDPGSAAVVAGGEQ